MHVQPLTLPTTKRSGSYNLSGSGVCTAAHTSVTDLRFPINAAASFHIAIGSYCSGAPPQRIDNLRRRPAAESWGMRLQRFQRGALVTRLFGIGASAACGCSACSGSAAGVAASPSFSTGERGAWERNMKNEPTQTKAAPKPKSTRPIRSRSISALTTVSPAAPTTNGNSASS
jgi:hypothetical protein